MSDISLCQYFLNNYFLVRINSRPFSPSYTLLAQLTEAIIMSEPDPDKINLKKLEWLYQNTHKELEEKLAVVELIVFRNFDRGVNYEIDLKGKTFYLFQLYSYLDSVSRELTQIIVEIAKKYNIDMPMITNKSQSSDISFK